MITSGKLQLNTDVEHILLALKRDALKIGKNLFAEIKDSNYSVQTNCPFHKNGAERKPSFGINKENGMWNCLTCHEKGRTLTSLVYKVLELPNYKAAEQWLINNFETNLFDNDTIPDVNYSITTVKKKPKLGVIKKIETNYVTEDELKKYRFYHPYMYKRNLTNDIINKYDVGYDNDFKLGEAITFPVKDEKGNVLFVARRCIKNKVFNYPAGVEKPLYGLFEARTYWPNSNNIVVCESILDALYLATLNIPAIALNGTGDTTQYKMMSELKGINTLFLALDNDKAGLKGEESIRKNVKHKYFCDFQFPKKYKDVGECPKQILIDEYNRLLKDVV